MIWAKAGHTTKYSAAPIAAMMAGTPAKSQAPSLGLPLMAYSTAEIEVAHMTAICETGKRGTPPPNFGDQIMGRNGHLSSPRNKAEHPWDFPWGFLSAFTQNHPQ
ncbi:hypothetical protein ACHMW4_29260 [Mesorhizobium sp. UC22_110]|uniref:hypothetical protein n=1 Tax=unclassified Mesorhizobium TaxID=325217 RepID=UPI00366B82FF